jgi:hypothetical protein
MKERIDRWHVATLPGPRGASAAAVAAALVSGGRGSERDTDVRRHRFGVRRGAGLSE